MFVYIYIYLVTYCLCTCAQGFHSNLYVCFFFCFFQPICCIISTFLPFEKVLFGHIALVLKLDCLLLSKMFEISKLQQTTVRSYPNDSVFKRPKGWCFQQCSTMLCVSWGNDPSIKVSGIIPFNKSKQHITKLFVVLGTCSSFLWHLSCRCLH